jgi:hypothetical protein
VPLQKLEELRIAGTQLRGEDLRFLRQFPDLRTLVVDVNQVNEVELQHLSAVKGLRQLYVEGIDDSRDPRLEAIKEKLPDCEIN